MAGASAGCFTALLIQRALVITETLFAAAIVAQDGCLRLRTGARMDDVDIT